MPSKDLVRIQVMVPKTVIPYLEKYMRERGYDFASQAVRRIILEYLSKYYEIPIEELLLKHVRV